MIDRNGQTVRYNDLDLNVGWTMNNYINERAIQIALVGNFQNEKPTEAQYAELKRVVSKLMKLNHKETIQIVGHKESSPTSCPGANFDITRIRELPGVILEEWGIPVKKKAKSKVITFHLSRYYAPLPNQTRYYAGRTFEADVKMNCWIDPKAPLEDNCKYTATGHPTVMSDKHKTVACDAKWKGKRIYLDGIGVVTCNDVGWAIAGNRIDMFCWVGEKALDERDTCKTGLKNGYLLD